MIEMIESQLPGVMLAIMFVVGEYILVFCAVVADLVSGLRKARRRGEARRSKALRRTVEKLATYYNALAALTVIDAMLMAAVVYLRVACGYDNVPLLPAMTLLGSIGIAIIEVKSIYEKAEEKEQRNFDDAAHMLAQCLKMLKDKGIINKIANDHETLHS